MLVREEEGRERTDIYRRPIQHPEERWIQGDALMSYPACETAQKLSFPGVS
jgi:hypothetical protein